MLGLNYCVGILLDFSVKCCVFAHFVCLEGAYVGPVIMVSRECTREGCVCCCSNKVYRGRAACTVLLHKVMTFLPRVHVYTYSKPAMMYGAETWAVKKAQEKKLDVAKMRMFRWMSGVTKPDRIRKKELEGQRMLEKYPRKCKKVG